MSVLVHILIYIVVTSLLYIVLGRSEKLPYDPDDKDLERMSENTNRLIDSLLCGAVLWIIIEILIYVARHKII